jgi:hypothetical protein
MVLRVAAFRLRPAAAVTADLRKVGPHREVASVLLPEAASALLRAAVTADLRRVDLPRASVPHPEAASALPRVAATADLPAIRLKGAGEASIRRCRSFCRSDRAFAAGPSASHAW